MRRQQKVEIRFTELDGQLIYCDHVTAENMQTPGGKSAAEIMISAAHRAMIASPAFVPSVPCPPATTTRNWRALAADQHVIGVARPPAGRRLSHN